MSSHDIIEIEGIAVKETSLAVLIDCRSAEVWVPKSAMEDWP